MMSVERRATMRFGLIVSLLTAAAGIGAANTALAQVNYFFRTPDSEINGFTLPPPPGPDGDYFVNDNWFEPNTQFRFVPEFDIGEGERAFIENGGTAFVNTTVPADQAAGQIVLGSAGGTSGTLEIQDGGVLASRMGTATNGAITVGSAGGQGTLRVLPGGTLTAEGSLVSGSNSANSITVGGLSGTTANLSANAGNLAATTRVFPNAAFSTNAGLNFGIGSNYIAEITGNNTSGKIDVGGTATLNGSLTLNFNSYVPSVGHNWTVLEAGTINGNFSSISTNASLPFNQNFVVTTPDVVGGQSGFNVSVQEVLVLEVNRNTGAAMIKHPGSANILLDGYFVGSEIGSLDSSGRISVNNQGDLGGDWVETAATANNVGELKPTNDGIVHSSDAISLGSIYDAFAGNFGQVNEDLEFSYRRSSDGTKFNGVVQYTGDAVNTLLLQVDPSGAGDAFLRNTSDTTVEIDAYEVLSQGGALTAAGWNSLDEQNSEGADVWLELDSNSNQIGEVNQIGFTTLAPGAALNLGSLYTGGAQDLEFSFLLMGDEEGEGTPGVVLYEAFTGGVPGDYNGNGVVDAADYTVWRDNLGNQNFTLPNEVETPGTVTQEDYTAWKSRFGNSAGSGSGAGASQASAVPEPTTWVLLIVAGLAACWYRQ
jgi:hypothetical protein